MSLHVENLNTLIAHLEAQPPERINMAFGEVELHSCRTCGCILGHAALALPEVFEYVPTARWFGDNFGLPYKHAYALTHPDGWLEEDAGVRRYPAHRVIATLKRLRDHYLATGEIVVDWGPEPGAEPAQPWRAPRATEITPPALPDSLTRILAGQPAALTSETAR